MASTPLISGLLFVHIRLRNPIVSTAPAFLRWTKLHFQDLLNLPAIPSSKAKVTFCLRATAPDDAEHYSHEEKPSVKPAIVHICAMDDLSVIKSKPFRDISPKLNLEYTRPLDAHEQAVGYKNSDGTTDKEALVSEIANSKLAVYEEVDSCEKERFQGLTPGNVDGCLVGVHFTLPSFSGDQSNDAVRIKDQLVELLQEDGAPGSKVRASLFRWAGKEAQPDGYPAIDVEGDAQWMVLAWLEHVCSDRVLQKDVDGVVGAWVKSDGESSVGEGGKIGYGVWDIELLMK